MVMFRWLLTPKADAEVVPVLYKCGRGTREIFQLLTSSLENGIEHRAKALTFHVIIQFSFYQCCPPTTLPTPWNQKVTTTEREREREREKQTETDGGRDQQDTPKMF